MTVKFSNIAFTTIYFFLFTFSNKLYHIGQHIIITHSCKTNDKYSRNLITEEIKVSSKKYSIIH